MYEKNKEIKKHDETIAETGSLKKRKLNNNGKQKRRIETLADLMIICPGNNSVLSGIGYEKYTFNEMAIRKVVGTTYIN